MNFTFVHEQPLGELRSLTVADIQLEDPFLPSPKRRARDMVLGADEVSTFTLDDLQWFVTCPTGVEVYRLHDLLAGGSDGAGGGSVLFPD